MKRRIRILCLAGGSNADGPVRRALATAPTFELLGGDWDEPILARLGRQEFDVVVGEVQAGDQAAPEVLKTLRDRCPAVPIFLVTGAAPVDLALAAVSQGAADLVFRTTETLRHLPALIEAWFAACPSRHPSGPPNSRQGDVGATTLHPAGPPEESALKDLVAGTAAVTGEAFFPAFTRHLAEALDARHVLVAEVVSDSPTQLRVLSFWSDSRWRVNFVYDTTGTPCDLPTASPREMVCIPDRLQERFPRVALLVGAPAVSYLGIPLLNAAGRAIGQVCVLDDRPLGNEQRARSILSIFAARAAAELERKRAEVMLRQYTERLQVLSRRLLEVQETERRHTALELHDEIGQALTALKFNLELCARQPTAALRAGLQQAQTTISSLIDQLREMSLDLRPPMLDHLGLLHALAWHCERFATRFQVHVRFHHSELEGKRFEPTLETAAYRIVQEALTNVARHAGVHEVVVEIRVEPEVLCLTISDHGRGFKAAEVLAAGTSSGLTGMRERATLSGGSLSVESSPGAGTLVRAALPLKRPPSNPSP